MTEEQASLVALERLSALLENAEVTSIHYDYLGPGRLRVAVKHAALIPTTLRLLPQKIIIRRDDQNTFEFAIVVEVGPNIRPLLADISVKPIQPLAALPAQGGDPCYIQGGNYWGTAGVYVGGVEMDATTRLGKKYTVSGDRAFFSCNHVIGDLDARPIGTPLVSAAAPGQPIQETAVLAGFFPVRDILIYLDFAVGANLNPPSYSHLVIRGIGVAKPNFRNPAEKGEIIRKSGARTGVTQGNTTGRVAIQAAGYGGVSRWYQGVYQTSPNFCDHGDSGSVVLGNGNDIVGMVAWGSDATPSVGYFFTFGSQSAFSSEETCKFKITAPES